METVDSQKFPIIHQVSFIDPLAIVVTEFALQINIPRLRISDNCQVQIRLAQIHLKLIFKTSWKKVTEYFSMAHRRRRVSLPKKLLPSYLITDKNFSWVPLGCSSPPPPLARKRNKKSSKFFLLPPRSFRVMRCELCGVYATLLDSATQKVPRVLQTITHQKEYIFLLHPKMTAGATYNKTFY